MWKMNKVIKILPNLANTKVRLLTGNVLYIKKTPWYSIIWLVLDHFRIINTCLFYVHSSEYFYSQRSWQTCPSLPRRLVTQNWDHFLWDSGLSKFMQRFYKSIRYSNILRCPNYLRLGLIGTIPLWETRFFVRSSWTNISTIVETFSQWQIPNRIPWLISFSWRMYVNLEEHF